MVTITPSHSPPGGRAQEQTCIKLSSLSNNQSVIGEQIVARTGYTTGTDENELLEYQLVKEKAMKIR